MVGQPVEVGGGIILQLVLAHAVIHLLGCALKVADLGIAALGGQGRPGGALLGLLDRDFVLRRLVGVRPGRGAAGGEEGALRNS